MLQILLTLHSTKDNSQRKFLVKISLDLLQQLLLNLIKSKLRSYEIVMTFDRIITIWLLRA